MRTFRVVMINNNSQSYREGLKGMTLVDVLLSITIISMLFAIIVSNIDVGDVFAKLWSTSDEIGVRAIGSAMADYRWDNGAEVPANANLAESLKQICKQTTSEADCSSNGGAYLNDLVPDYINEIPIHRDFVSDAELMTGYQIQYPVAGGRVRVTNQDESDEFVH